MSILPVWLLVTLVAFSSVPVWAQTTGTLTLTAANTAPCAPELQLPNFRCATLAQDHRGTIVIAGHRIRLDCAGRIVRGSGPSAPGITITSFEGVMVENCHVTSFRIGINLNGADRSVFRQNQVDGNGEGIRLEGSRGNIFLRNTVNENFGDGFDLRDSNENFFEDNEVTQNAGHGIVLDSSHNTTFEGNIVSGNGEHGFSLNGSRANIFKRNIANNNGDIGFALENGSGDNTFVANSASGNDGGDAVQAPPSDQFPGSFRNWYLENTFRVPVGLFSQTPP